MKRQEMAASRVVPGDPVQTFHRVLPMPLDRLFIRWYGPIPPIGSTDGPVPWHTAGQQRRVNLVGPGWMTETLTEVDPPHQFSYRLDQLHGPMSALIAAVDGRWSFAPTEPGRPTGTTVTWTWLVTPRSGTRVLLPAFTTLWTGYAERALLRLEVLLHDSEPPADGPGY